MPAVLDALGRCPFRPLCTPLPGCQTYVSEEHLKEFANAYSINENDFETAKKLLRKESQLPTSLEQFL